MSKNNKLELTWVGKDKEVSVEPRILIENKDLSNIKKDKDTENMLIHGDNLLALKALEHDFAGKIKCIYIDPPYNTGARIDADGKDVGYDDGIEHSEWLNMMAPRLKLLKTLLHNEGTIFVQIDRNEQAYLKVLMDEIFGRNNFITMITCKVTSPGGLTGGTEMFFDSSEYVLVYAKNKNNLTFNVKKIDAGIMGETQFGYNYKIHNINYDSKQFIKEEGGIKYYSIDSNNFKFETVQDSELIADFYYNNCCNLFQTANLSGGIGKKIKNATSDIDSKENLIICNYIPTKGKRKGIETNLLLWKNRIVYKLEDYVRIDHESKKLIKLDYVTNIFNDSLWNGISSEGNVTFNNGKKPERFLQTLLEIASNEDDLVLDSFNGSGTTSAVAHKLRRKWIGVEMGPHCYSHCKKRLDNVIDGDKSGISKSVKWQGGGGYRFYDIAPTLIKEDDFGQMIINPEYNAQMLASAVAKHEGYFYNPDSTVFWKQSNNQGKSFLYVTTNHVNSQLIETIKADMQEDEFVLIVCKSFDSNCNSYKNIAIKKIPQSLLKNCEFGVDNYNLNIISPPEYFEEDEDE